MPRASAAARFVDSAPFTAVVVGTIGVNAVVLGLQTYEELDERWGSTLLAINCLIASPFCCLNIPTQ